MPDQSGQQANADVSEKGLEIGKEYDENRARLADERENGSEDLGDDRALQGGVIVSGTGAPGGLVTMFPGAVDRFGDVEEADQGGIAARAAKGLDTGDVTADDTTWTAQSAQGYVADNAQDVPGQTYRVDELPDPRVVNSSSLPAHTIPEHLVVDGTRTDDISSSQERPSDVGTAPSTPRNPSLEADKAGGRAAGRAEAKKAGDRS